ncbi:MAG TPA: hypothetical protein VGN65_14925, partial [Casimicrobiaceae bacterium]
MHVTDSSLPLIMPRFSSIRFSVAAVLAAAAIVACTTSADQSVSGLLKPIDGPNKDAVASTPLVISQVYGGGGNAGATYKNDFIEVFNPGTAAVVVTGWSVQYASAAGTS